MNITNIQNLSNVTFNWFFLNKKIYKYLINKILIDQTLKIKKKEKKIDRKIGKLRKD